MTTQQAFAAFEQELIGKGIEKGFRQGLIEAITLGLELRFGPRGSALVPGVEAVSDLERLRAIKRALAAGEDLERIRTLIGR